jgi:hypothetical protein
LHVVVRWLPTRDEPTALYRIAQPIKPVVILLDDPAVLVAAVHAALRGQAFERVEDLELAILHQLKNVLNAALNGIVSLLQLQPGAGVLLN